jgi:HEAT repeat protein
MCNRTLTILPILAVLIFAPTCWAEESREALIKELRNGSLKARLVAIGKVEQMKELPPEFLPVLVELIQYKFDSSSEGAAAFSFVLKHKATLMLANAGEAALPALRQLMKNDDARWKAVEVLQRMGVRALPALPELIDALGDKNGSVRYFAAKAIMQFGPAGKAAVPALIQHINDPHDSAREFSIQALGEIGAAAEPALPALAKVAKHEWSLTQSYAEGAIKQIKEAVAKEPKK